MAITPLMPVYPRSPVRPVRGEGVYLYGEQGEQYLDFAAGIAVNILGHGHPHLTKAIQDQAATLMHVSNLYGIPQGEAFAQRLMRPDLRRHGVLHQFGRRGGRMRDQDRAPLPLRQGQSAQARPDHLLERLPRADDGDDQRDRPAQDDRRLRAAAAGLQGGRRSTISTRRSAAIDENTAGFLVEPIQGEGGIRPASHEFLAGPARRLRRA